MTCPNGIWYHRRVEKLGWIDGGVIVVYLALVTWLGLRMGRGVTRSAEFFMPRKFGKGKMIMHAFGTGTASDQAVSVASATFQQGLSGIWYQWLWLFSTPFYWIIAPIMRRFRATTTADVLELRYNRSVAMLFAVVGIASMSVKIGVMLKGAGALVESGTGGLINAPVAIAVVTLLFVVYGMVGGLGAAVVTDFIQGILTIVFSFLLLPFVLQAVGGLTGMRSSIAEGITDRDMLSLVAPGEVGAFFIIMLSIQALVGIVAFPSAMGNCAAGKTEMEGRVGFMCGTFIKRVCTIAWCLTAISAVAWYLDSGVDLAGVKPDNVYGDVARAFLPEVMPGLLGIFIATLLAAVMSSCDSFMIAASGLFTENLYRPLSKGREPGHYIQVGRLAALVIVLIGVGFAFYLEDVVKGLKIWFKITPMMGMAFWLGLFWRRMTTAGAWASTLAGFGTWWLLSQSWVVDRIAGWPGADSLRFLWEGKVYEPWVILAYLTAGVGIGMAVSLVTRPGPKERLDRYYALTRTPVRVGETVETPCTLPAGTPPAERALLFAKGGFEIPRPSKTAWLGFGAGWLGIIILIGGFVWLVS
ncbi:MAG: sodium:solute symporter family protein [Verrucomicrobiota bacterium]